MTDTTAKQASRQNDLQQSDSQQNENPEQARRKYGYGLGHFLKSKQRYIRAVENAVEKERNRSFELGYN